MLKHYRRINVSAGSILLNLIFVSFALAQTPIPNTYPITWAFNVPIAMRDGVQLSSDIIRPDSTERFPTFLLRTPYNKGDEIPRAQIVYWAQHGYVVVVQDVRGRHDSAGVWEPFFHESDDGYDTQQWVAKQNWSNGEVVSWGESYVAMQQWLAAIRHNPNLKGMVSIVSPFDIYENLAYPGGAFQEAVQIWWSTYVDGHVVQPQEADFVPWSKVFEHLPVTDALRLTGRNPQFYGEWLAHPNYDSYWRRLRWQESYEKFDFPVLNIGGWFDIFQRGAIENFQRLRARGPERVRDLQRLIIGPWSHSVGQMQVGDVSFGPEAKLNVSEITLRWADHFIKGIDNGFEKESPVKVFTMGENVWHGYRDWPIPGTQYVKYFLRSAGRANTLLGDGALSTSLPPADEKSDHYAYDPADPVPTAGGGNCCVTRVTPWGPMDQRAVERRDDVLVYTTPALETDLRVTGPIEVKLWVASTARDTDFTVKLVDVYPNGFAMNLTDGIVRAPYRDSFEKPELIEPGRLYEVTIQAGNTSNLFTKGHKIRVEIASSNFPRYSRNTNTGRQPETDLAGEVARQTIFHNSEHSSYMALPVLPE